MFIACIGEVFEEIGEVLLFGKACELCVGPKARIDDFFNACVFEAVKEMFGGGACESYGEYFCVCTTHRRKICHCGLNNNCCFCRYVVLQRDGCDCLRLEMVS